MELREIIGAAEFDAVNHELFQAEKMENALRWVRDYLTQANFDKARPISLSQVSRSQVSYSGASSDGFVEPPNFGDRGILLGKTPLSYKSQGRYSHDDLGISLYALAPTMLLQQTWFMKVKDDGSDVFGGRIEDETTDFRTKRMRRFAVKEGSFKLEDDQMYDMAEVENITAFRFVHNDSGLKRKMVGAWDKELTKWRTYKQETESIWREEEFCPGTLEEARRLFMPLAEKLGVDYHTSLINPNTENVAPVRRIVMAAGGEYNSTFRMQRPGAPEKINVFDVYTKRDSPMIYLVKRGLEAREIEPGLSRVI